MMSSHLSCKSRCGDIVDLKTFKMSANATAILFGLALSLFLVLVAILSPYRYYIKELNCTYQQWNRSIRMYSAAYRVVNLRRGILVGMYSR